MGEHGGYGALEAVLNKGEAAEGGACGGGEEGARDGAKEGVRRGVEGVEGGNVAEIFR